MAKTAKDAEMRPFLFERSFDAFGDDRGAAIRAAQEEQAAAAKAEDVAANPDVALEDSEPEIEVVFSEGEMEAAKQDSYMNGHADGFREGHAEAMDTLERQLNEVLEQLPPLIAALGEEQTRAHDRAESNMIRIVQAIMGRVMPIYLAKHGPDEVMAIVSDCLAELQEPGKLTIRVSEDTANNLGDRLKKSAERAGFEGQLRMIPDETLGASDVRVEWKAGGAERNYDEIREEIDAAINHALERAEAALMEKEAAQAAPTPPESSTAPLEEAPAPMPELDERQAADTGTLDTPAPEAMGSEAMLDTEER